MTQPTPYKGRKDAEGIVAFMSARAGPPVQKLATSEAIDVALDDAAAVAATVVIGAFSAGYEGAYHLSRMMAQELTCCG